MYRLNGIKLYKKWYKKLQIGGKAEEKSDIMAERRETHS